MEGYLVAITNRCTGVGCDSHYGHHPDCGIEGVDDVPVKCQRHCGGCGKPMRNQGEDPGMWPGTVAVRARGRCGPCYLQTRNAV